MERKEPLTPERRQKRKSGKVPTGKTGPQEEARLEINPALATLFREFSDRSLEFSREVTERSGVRVRLGQLLIDSVGFDEALQRIERLVDARRGGMVFTPNVDHVSAPDGRFVAGAPALATRSPWIHQVSAGTTGRPLPST